MYFRPFIWGFMTPYINKFVPPRNLTEKTYQLQTGMCYFSGLGGEGQPLLGGSWGDAIYMLFCRKCDFQEILHQQPKFLYIHPQISIFRLER